MRGKALAVMGCLAAALVLVVAGSGLAGRNADKWMEEAKNTQTVLNKSVWDLTPEDMEKLIAVIDTSQGIIKVKFYPQVAPNHVKNFILLAEKKFYDSLGFHRIIKGFMIQGGDPQGNGTGGPDWTVDAEFSQLKHHKGTLSMARQGGDPNSGGSQFFICLADTAHLDGKYSVFGDVIEGLDVVDKIGAVPTKDGETPAEKPVIKTIRIVLKDQAPAAPTPATKEGTPATPDAAKDAAKPAPPDEKKPEPAKTEEKKEEAKPAAPTDKPAAAPAEKKEEAKEPAKEVKEEPAKTDPAKTDPAAPKEEKKEGPKTQP